MNKKLIKQSSVRKTLVGVLLVVLIGAWSNFILSSSSEEGDALLGVSLLVILSVVQILLLLRLIATAWGRSTAQSVAWALAVGIVAVAYWCMLRWWGAHMAVYAFVTAIFAMENLLFSLWLIYALQGWMKIVPVLMAAFAVLWAGWSLLAAALLGSS